VQVLATSKMATECSRKWGECKTARALHQV
jgi:hypothetical protein